MIKYIKKTIKNYLILYKPLKRNKLLWNIQFEEGNWDYLNSIQELSRYSLIIGYYNFFIENGSVLDLGCGQGILHQRFKNNYIKYVGIDISEKAISLAKQNGNEKSEFICEDFAGYIPNQKFDFIVFNESLYYFEKPLELINKYVSYLNPNGKIVISMWDNPERNNKIWTTLNGNFKIWDELKLQNGLIKVSWIIKVIN